jgi:hypothetical protein
MWPETFSGRVWRVPIDYGSDSPIHSPKFRTALELYAAHFDERQVRVRFLLLVIAMEALAVESPKDQPALGFVEHWIDELNEEKANHEKSSSEYRSLDSPCAQCFHQDRRARAGRTVKLADLLHTDNSCAIHRESKESDLRCCRPELRQQSRAHARHFPGKRCQPAEGTI